MPFFQNNFNQDFLGVLVLSDRQYSLDFKVRGNINTSVDMVAWNREPYNLASSPNLTINYSLDSGATWAAMTIDVTAGAVSTSAVTCDEVAAALNANVTFAALFDAYVMRDTRAGNFLKLRAEKSRERWKSYISNSSAESVLRFNKKSGVAELPTYFSRHNIASIGDFPDCCGLLVELDVADSIDQAIITDALLDYTDEQADWQLLRGRASGQYAFTKNTVNVSNQITETIYYGAGAVEGDLAVKTIRTYTGTQTVPDKICEIPWVLTSADLVTP